MTTRLKSRQQATTNESQQQLATFLTTKTPSEPKPKGFWNALKSPIWKKAMGEELQALSDNKT